MNKAMKILLSAAFAVTMSGAPWHITYALMPMTTFYRRDWPHQYRGRI